jgi:hypothetical protein
MCARRGHPSRQGGSLAIDQTTTAVEGSHGRLHDFNASDYYQRAHLVNKAVNELCPAQTWQLRQSAAGYRKRDPVRVASASLISVGVLYPTSPWGRIPGWGPPRSGPGTARWQQDRR